MFRNWKFELKSNDTQLRKTFMNRMSQILVPCTNVLIDNTRKDTCAVVFRNCGSYITVDFFRAAQMDTEISDYIFRMDDLVETEDFTSTVQMTCALKAAAA